MNQLSRNTEAEKLPPELVEYATTVISGLHVALRQQTKPSYHRPDHPVNGWGLTSTPIVEKGEIAGIPTTNLLGDRSIYLSTRPELMLRVLTVPHPRRAFEERVIQRRATWVSHLLHEDPTLYGGLLKATEYAIKDFELNYQLPEAPTP